MSTTLERTTIETMADACIAVRETVMKEAAVSGSGHYGPSMSCVEILVALYHGFLRYDSADPRSPDRDRFVLSKGHACSALYAVLSQVGFFPREDLSTYTRLGSRFGDHPDMRKVPGIDFSSGALGHGLSIGLGMAMAGELDGSGVRAVVLLGDGELNEGQIWEAAGHAGAKSVSNLLAIVDGNKVCVDGEVSDVMSYEPIDAKFASFGWGVERVDGHSLTSLLRAFDRFEERRQADAGPTVILADTIAGKGIEFIEGMAEWHIGHLDGIDVERALTSIRNSQARN